MKETDSHTNLHTPLHSTSLGQVYEFAKTQGFIPYDTCMPYLACSDDSKEGFCQHIDTSCQKHNICRTCSTFSSFGGTCDEVCAFAWSISCVLSPHTDFLFIIFSFHTTHRSTSSPMHQWQNMVLITSCHSIACIRLRAKFTAADP